MFITVALVLWVSLCFSLFDYLGYNTLGQKNIVVYRGLQVVVGVVLSFVLLTLASMKAFLLGVMLWWTFNDDLLYYAFAELLRSFPAEVGSFKKDFFGEPVVTWAWWTPYGLYRWLLKKQPRLTPISGAILFLQAGAGVALFAAVVIVTGG